MLIENPFHPPDSSTEVNPGLQKWAQMTFSMCPSMPLHTDCVGWGVRIVPLCFLPVLGVFCRFGIQGAFWHQSIPTCMLFACFNLLEAPQAASSPPFGPVTLGRCPSLLYLPLVPHNTQGKEQLLLQRIAQAEQTTWKDLEDQLLGIERYRDWLVARYGFIL